MLLKAAGTTPYALIEGQDFLFRSRCAIEPEYEPLSQTAKGELKKAGREAKKRGQEADAANTAYQMLLAINYLHKQGIVHRDIKLDNFLYESLAEVRCTLANVSALPLSHLPTPMPSELPPMHLTLAGLCSSSRLRTPSSSLSTSALRLRRRRLARRCGSDGPSCQAVR